MKDLSAIIRELVKEAIEEHLEEAVSGLLGKQPAARRRRRRSALPREGTHLDMIVNVLKAKPGQWMTSVEIAAALVKRYPKAKWAKENSSNAVTSALDRFVKDIKAGRACPLRYSMGVNERTSRLVRRWSYPR